MPPDVLLTRSAEFRPNSYNPETRTFTAVIATASPVQRRDAAGPFQEVLPAEAFDLSHQNLPLIDSHNLGTVRAILGRTLSIRREGDVIVAEAQLSSAEDVAPIGQRIADGSLSGMSIGYRSGGWATRTEGGCRIKTATRVSISEVTLTSNPADPHAAVRQQEESTMPKDTEDRAGLIARVRATHNLPEEWATRMSEAGEEISDDEIRASGREEAVAIRATRTTPPIRTAAPAAGDAALARQHRAEALTARMTGEAPTDGARAYMGETLADMARAGLESEGVSTRGMSREEMLTRAAQHTTSDFPGLLVDSGHRVLANAYRRAESVLKTIARQRTMADFRATTILKVGEMGTLKKVTESGEITATTLAEAKEGYSLSTFGRLFSLSRQALINDDLGAFGRWGEMMGQAAAETEAEQLLALLTANAGGGVKLGDGKNLFHADHGNLAGAGAALSETTLSAARLAMRTQKGLDSSTPVNVVPTYLLVGPALETTAEKLLATINPAATDDVNVFGGRLKLLVEPRITGNGWWVFGDPAAAPVLEYAYLSSAPGPQMASRDGWDVLGREFRVILDFGCGAVDHRGAYRNAGA